MPSNSITAVAGLAGALAFTAGATVAGVHPASAEPARAVAPAPAAPDDEIPAPPPTFKAGGVTVDEHLGGRVPLDAKFRSHDGAVVTLGEVLRGELPAILTFNYSDCPMLCSVQLNGLTAALPAVGQPGPSPSAGTAAGVAPAGVAPAGAGGDARDVVFRVGQQFRIVTIDLEPSETLDKARAMRKRYIDRLPEDQRAAAETGWTFLVAATPGDDAAIRRVADAVGFRYAYIKDRAEWAHPAALIMLTATGVVTRYLYGIEFDPAVMRESIYKAGIAEPASAVGFMLRCYHYDPAANSHARAGVLALRFAAAGFVVLLAAALAILHFMRRGKAAPHGAT
jgi:protein SCO1